MTDASDVIQIYQGYALLGHVLDRGEWHRLSDVFAAHAVIESPMFGNHEGLEAISAYLQKEFEIGPVHHMTNPHVDFDVPGSAAARAKLLTIFPDGTLLSGEYRDHWIRQDEGWRLVRRASTVFIELAATPNQRIFIGDPAAVDDAGRRAGLTPRPRG